MVVLLLVSLPVAVPTIGQGRSMGGQGLNATFAYTRKKVSFDGMGRKKPIEGALTLPRRSQRSPAILFVTGAWNASKVGLGEGEELRSLADYLGEHGIAVLQLNLPFGGRSITDLNSATGATFETDIRAGLTYLKQRPEIDPRRIGLFGQNENGAVATVIATLNKDVSFLILAGTPIVENEPSTKPSGPVNTYDLRPILEKITCPVLVMQGDQDTSVPLRENLTAYRNVLVAANNHDTAFVALPGLNRALETTTGNGRSESDMAPLAMRTLVRWIYRDAPVNDTPFNAASSGDEDEKVTHRKPSNPYGDVPGGVIGQFRYRREMLWIPPIGGQPRPYGYWYW
ncbi:MAG: hypothetical protein JWL77_2853 [Chthonomonadaceae bacterium]|nr:hypothetical protein [Chthonomonadaceae bacterium]